MPRVTLYVIDTDGSTSRTVEVGPGSRIEVAGPIAEGERVWIVFGDADDDGGDLVVTDDFFDGDPAEADRPVGAPDPKMVAFFRSMRGKVIHR